MVSDSIPSKAEAEPEFGSDLKTIDNSDIVELERIIELAEDIQKHMDTLRTRSVLPAAMSLAGGVGVTISLLWLTEVWMIALGVTVCGGVALSGLTYSLRLTNDLAAERRSLEEVLDVAREVEQGLAASGKLRPLTRARLRIRLSRFKLGGGAMNLVQLLAKTMRQVR